MSDLDAMYHGSAIAQPMDASKPSTRPASVHSSVVAKSTISGQQHSLTAETLRLNDAMIRSGAPSGAGKSAELDGEYGTLTQGGRSGASINSFNTAASKKPASNRSTAQGQQPPWQPNPWAAVPTDPPLEPEMSSSPRLPSHEPSKAGSRPASVAGSARSNATSALARKHAAAAAAAAAEAAEAAVAQDLRAEAQPWNELQPVGDAAPSAVNSIASYGNVGGGDGGAQEADAPRAPSRQGSVAASHRSAANSGGRRSSTEAQQVAPEASSRPASVLDGAARTAAPPPPVADPDGVQGPPPKTPSREASKAGSRPPSAAPSNRSVANSAGRQSAGGGKQDGSRPPSIATNLDLEPEASQGVLSREPSQSHVLPVSRPLSVTSISKSVGRKSLVSMAVFEPLPWSAQALVDFRLQMKKSSFQLLDPADNPLTARMDSVFSLPQELWPVLPAGALYCLEGSDPRASFSYFQHTDFPDTKVRVNTYFGKWGRHLVDFVVAFQPTPRAEAAFQPGNAKQPPLPWEPRQVVAHTTSGEYQYANTRMRFRGPKGPLPDAPMVDWCDAHGIDLLDTKAANETAARNSDKDRDAHLIDPPRPNTWGELARRPLIGNLRNRGGGAYVHHVNYDHTGLRTTCGRRVPAGYFFTLAPNAPAKTPAVPGSHVRSSSCGRSLAGRKSCVSVVPTVTGAGAEASTARLDPSYSVLSSVAPQGSVPALPSGLAATADAAFGEGVLRPTSASAARSRPSSAGSQQDRLPKLMSAQTVTTLESFRSAWMGGQLQREASRPTTAATPTAPSLFTLMPKTRWCTYDVPFHHPIHVARATDLGMALALESGTGVRSFSDAAAVLKIAEQELKLTRPFVPGPLVVSSWNDVPRLYAEHMAAARALMPVTELDTYASSKLHQLLHHLQHAATLEYDRLDAKLLLLSQMARLGRKSVEIDAWLQVIVEHAAYLYDKLQITDTERWAPAAAAPPQPPTSSSGGGGDATAIPAGVPFRRSVTFFKAAPLVSPTGSPSWAFPEPLVGTSFAERSALNVVAQKKPPLPEQPLAAHLVSVEEWAAIAKIMDTARHAILHDQWVRLRPLMTGSAQPSAYSASRPGSTYCTSDAAATIHDLGADPVVPETELDAAFSHGKVNRELLDYVNQDLAAMGAPDYTPPPMPPNTGLPPARGFRGPGPLPPELVAEMPTVHRPVRCRGADETPLPEEFNGMDLWNVRHKADQAATSPEDPSPLDAGALRFSQVSIHRLNAAKGFANSRQAEVRRSLQRAAGTSVWDESSTPEYGSDIAEEVDDMAGEGYTRRRRPLEPPVPSLVPGMATQTTEELEGPSLAEQLLRDAAKAREAADAAEVRRKLLTGNGGKTREQVLEEALKAAEAAIHSLQPRPVGAVPISEPSETSRGLVEDGEPYAWKPFGRGQEPYARSLDSPSRGLEPVMPFNRQFSRAASNTGRNIKPESYGKGPEPFSLERALSRLATEPSVLSENEPLVVPVDIPKTNAGGFGGVSIGIGGLLDYETAMARRRAIAGAEIAHDRSDFIPRADVLTLFVTYCNLGGHPDLVEMLQRAIEAPVSADNREAVATANRVVAAQSSVARRLGAAAAAAKQKMDEETEAERQRIRATAWLLGVTWRRITNETYTSFLCRVLGWPGDIAISLHRTRCTHIIAAALVRGHDLNSVPKPPPRH